MDGISNNTATGGETQTVQHCTDSTASSVEFVFIDGSFNSEVSFTISDASDGSVIGSATGSGSYDLIWEGTTFTDGDTFYTETNLTGGSDCDDSDCASQSICQQNYSYASWRERIKKML